MMFVALIALLPLLPLINAIQSAGHESYARDSRRLLRRVNARRSTYIPAFEPESVTFGAGSKQYLSPTGHEFQSYTLDSTFGLEEYTGKTILLTVVPVEGNVTCDALGAKVAEYTKMDDVWDPVRMSLQSVFGGQLMPSPSCKPSCLRAPTRTTLTGKSPIASRHGEDR